MRLTGKIHINYHIHICIVIYFPLCLTFAKRLKIGATCCAACTSVSAVCYVFGGENWLPFVWHKFLLFFFSLFRVFWNITGKIVCKCSEIHLFWRLIMSASQREGINRKHAFSPLRKKMLEEFKCLWAIPFQNALLMCKNLLRIVIVSKRRGWKKIIVINEQFI